MSSLADRVKQRMTELKLRHSLRARLAQVKPPSVAQWLNGRTKEISGETLLLAATALQCSPKWLATGVGPRNAEEGHRAEEPRAAYVFDRISDQEAEALRLFKSLSATNQAEAMAVLRWLATKQTSAFKATGKQQRDPVPGTHHSAAA